MKIAFICQPLDRVIPPSQNSIGIWIYEVARRLAKNHEVHVYANGGLKPRRAVTLEGVHFHFIRSRTFKQMNAAQAIHEFFNPIDKPLFASTSFSLEYVSQAAIDIRRRGIELVQTVNFSQYAPVVKAFNPKVKFVLNMQCEWLSQLDYATIAKRLEKTDLVLGCSDYITQLVRDRFPQYAPRCQTVYNGVDEISFTPSAPGINKRTPARILFVSRLSPEKGVHVLLRAFKEVAAQHPDVELELIGSPGAAPLEFLVQLSDDQTVIDLARYYKNGSYFEHLKAEIPLELEPRVIFRGHMGRDEITARFKEADMLINPSLSEPFGMALVEGMAAGLPVIAPRVGGMVEIIQDGKTGFLVNPNDPHDLALAILKLLNSPDLRAAMGKAGRQRVSEVFTWDRIVERLLARYDTMVSEREQPSPSDNRMGDSEA